ncbi:hypothetical protein BTHERMOSOX_730 [Bathymodiolus thermophilus thioautotrophic gill symbiont]|uniref:hypothetical protein n=1 Tax=Bathymodiolus thermophilus thioautotrophic gill symbiont TaxID=2360 RepID=UPI0010B6C09A|nr:hypothetical protein [Bathymodiolus thermophilus thioautotrophic gill symbiont]SHA02997.1 hypothetical protein BTHERMOSOX_730 [Bathymodiolus thermophilus thioautotrophic gill symbiont]
MARAFFSPTLDEKNIYYCFAYVENNPIKAKMVEKAIDCIYLSARHHSGLVVDGLITDYDIEVEKMTYEKYLQTMCYLNNDILKRIALRNVSFIDQLSGVAGKDLSFKGIGRAKKVVASLFIRYIVSRIC